MPISGFTAGRIAPNSEDVYLHMDKDQRVRLAEDGMRPQADPASPEVHPRARLWTVA